MTEKNADVKEESLAYKKPESHRTTISLLAAFLVILLVISVLAYKSGIDPKKVKADIESFKHIVKERYAEQGVDVTFDYKGIDAEGGLFERTITLSEPTLSIDGRGASYKLHSPEARIIPNDEEYKVFNVELSAPVTVAYGQDKEARYIADAPTSVVFTLLDEGKQQYTLQLPKNIRLEHSTPKNSTRYDVALDPASSVITGVLHSGSVDDYLVDISLSKAKIERDAATVVMDHFQYRLEATAELDSIEVSADGLVGDMIPVTLSPLSVKLVQRNSVDTDTAQSFVNLDTFVVNGTDFNVNVEGRLSVVEKELLPLADIDVSVIGAEKLLATIQSGNHISPRIRRVIVNALKRIAPEWDGEQTTPLDFSVHRREDGPFMVGAIKADELLALALRQYFSGDAEVIVQMSSEVSEVPTTVSDAVVEKEEIVPAGEGVNPTVKGSIEPVGQEVKEEAQSSVGEESTRPVDGNDKIDTNSNSEANTATAKPIEKVNSTVAVDVEWSDNEERSVIELEPIASSGEAESQENLSEKE